MKKNSILFAFVVYFVSACNSQSSQQATFYDEKDYNTVKEIKTFNSHLFILGQHFLKEGNIQHTASLLCLDTSLNRIWDKHFGNVNVKERFESFSMNSKGDIFLSGYNEQLKCALLVKLNVKGETAWRKEYKDFNTFRNIEVYNDTAVIVTATKRFSETELVGDSAYIQKLDPDGNVVWTSACCLHNALGFLKLAKDKIIFFTNAGFYNPPYPNSKLFCLDQSGKIDWVYNLDPASTSMASGVKAIKLKTDNNGLIYTLCQSHNMRDMALFTFDLTGQKLHTYQPDFDNLPNEKLKGKNDDILLFTGFNLDIYQKEPVQIIVKKDQQHKPYFAATDAGNQLIDFVKLNNTIFKIANTGDLGNHISKWLVIKDGE